MLTRKILKANAVTAKRYSIQSSAYTATLVNIINSAGGNLKDFDISLKSAKVHSNVVISENGLKIKEDFIEIAQGKLLCAYFDTKIVKEYSYGSNRNVERLALVISSPSINKKQLIIVLSIPDCHGITQVKATKEILESWNLWDLVHSVCFETTFSNTGEKNLCTQWYNREYFFILIFSKFSFYFRTFFSTNQLN